MSDIYLKSTAAGLNIIVNAGCPQMTGGLDNAVYMSLFTADFWGNDISEQNEKYDSTIPDIVGSGVLNNKLRLDIIAEAQRVLQWLITAGIAESVTVTAEIPKVGNLYLAVKINQPNRVIDYAYSVNWDTQEITVKENLW